jgi:hypothetical protein
MPGECPKRRLVAQLSFRKKAPCQVPIVCHKLSKIALRLRRPGPQSLSAMADMVLLNMTNIYVVLKKYTDEYL